MKRLFRQHRKIWNCRPASGGVATIVLRLRRRVVSGHRLHRFSSAPAISPRSSIELFKGHRAGCQTSSMLTTSLWVGRTSRPWAVIRRRGYNRPTARFPVWSLSAAMSTLRTSGGKARLCNRRVDCGPAGPDKKLRRGEAGLDAFAKDEFDVGVERNQSDRAARESTTAFALKFFRGEVGFAPAVSAEIGNMYAGLYAA